MERWYTARELVDLALPGMPGKSLSTLIGFINQRKYTGFARYRRTGHGKAIEIHFSALPAETQAELRRRYRPRSLPPLIRQRVA